MPTTSLLRIEARPILDLGGLRRDAKEELDERQPFLSAVQLDDGIIVVNETSQLKFFSASGAYLRTAGRKGSGPGEFSQTREVCRFRGDSLLVTDYSDGRLSVWTAAGNHVSTLARPGFVAEGTCRPDGTVIVRGLIGPGRTAEYWISTPDGGKVRSLGLLPTAEYSGPILREVSIVPYGEELIVGDARSFEARIVGRDGRVRRVLRVVRPPRLVSDDEWKSLVLSMIPLSASEEQRQSMLTRMSAQAKPSAFPAFSHIRTDPERRIWFNEYGNSSAWTVFDRNGVLLGRVELPWVSSSLAGFTRDRIIVRHRDVDGAVHLSFHRLLESQR